MKITAYIVIILAAVLCIALWYLDFKNRTERSEKISNLLKRISECEAYAQGSCYANTKLDGMGQYLHLAHLTGKKQLWGPAFKYIGDIPDRITNVKIDELFDTATPGDILKLGSMEPCVSKELFEGYRLRSFLMMGYDDAITYGTDTTTVAGKYYTDRNCSWRIWHSTGHYLIIAMPETCVGPVFCLSERGISEYEKKDWEKQKELEFTRFENYESHRK